METRFRSGVYTIGSQLQIRRNAADLTNEYHYNKKGDELYEQRKHLFKFFPQYTRSF